MKDVLSNYIDDFVLVFLDGILVYYRTMEQHIEHLGRVLEALKTNSLFCQGKKMQCHDQGGKIPWEVDYTTRDSSNKGQNEDHH